MGSRADHWDRIHATKGDETSWFQPTLERSLAMISGLELPPRPTAIDVGSGSSSLAGDLLDRGFGRVTLVDLSSVALGTAAARLGARAERARTVVGDITEVELPADAFDVWHDRGVFHFLTDERRQAAYVRQVRHALRPGGAIVIATFGLEGPEQCSGLPVVRYDAARLHAAFGPRAFRLLAQEHERHQTPWGTEQEFIYCSFRCEAC